MTVVFSDQTLFFWTGSIEKSEKFIQLKWVVMLDERNIVNRHLFRMSYKNGALILMRTIASFLTIIHKISVTKQGLK